MIDAASYLMFLLASLALILVPGPAQALVISRTLAADWRAGLLTAVGLNVGTLFHAAAAALGLSAILATSALAFSLVKYAGAAYLIWLGIRLLRSGGPSPTPSRVAAESAGSVFVQALAAGILNPKVAIFFLAFLPQFVDPAAGNAFMQFMLLGATMAILDTLYEAVLIFGVSRLRERFLAGSRLRAWLNRVSAGVMFALGLRLAIQER